MCGPVEANGRVGLLQGGEEADLPSAYRLRRHAGFGGRGR